jgi:integrase
MKVIMKNQWRMYIRGKASRGKVWWCENSEGKRESLKTKNKAEAQSLLAIKNQPHQSADFHLLSARTHLLVSDPQSVTRTWQQVMDAIIGFKKPGPTKDRWERAAESEVFDSIRDLVVSNTKADDFLKVLACGKVSANVYLRRLHNFAQDMNWLLAPVIAKRAWPKVEYGAKRAITPDEHKKIIEREKNPERRAFYECCWHIGGAQSDIANLTAENIDWENRSISFHRKKTGQHSKLSFGSELEKVLKSLPATGKLFPYLAGVREADRATEFRQRCAGLGIKGVTLHSYRYSWAERAKAAGYPERYAQIALGHGSKAIARAYARHGDVELPSLEDYQPNRLQPAEVAERTEPVALPTALAA